MAVRYTNGSVLWCGVVHNQGFDFVFGNDSGLHVSDVTVELVDGVHAGVEFNQLIDVEEGHEDARFCECGKLIGGLNVFCERANPGFVIVFDERPENNAATFVGCVSGESVEVVHHYIVNIYG